jgi:hypothetical protein
MIEPITSLLQRELTVLSKNFGQLGRTSWELSRLLLRARSECDKMAINKGESGAEVVDCSVTPAVVVRSASDDPFGPNLEFDYD